MQEVVGLGTMSSSNSLSRSTSFVVWTLEGFFASLLGDPMTWSRMKRGPVFSLFSNVGVSMTFHPELRAGWRVDSSEPEVLVVAVQLAVGARVGARAGGLKGGGGGGFCFDGERSFLICLIGDESDIVGRAEGEGK
jgi:hypothetical protein